MQCPSCRQTHILMVVIPIFNQGRTPPSTIMHILIIAFFISLIIPGSYAIPTSQPPTQFGAFQFGLWSYGSSTIQTSGSFTCSISGYTSVINWGIGISGFSFQSSTYISFGSQLSKQSDSSYTATFSVGDGMGVYYAQIYIIIATAPAASYLNIWRTCHSCNVISTSTPGYIGNNRPQSETTSVSMTSFSFSNTSEYNSIVYINSMKSTGAFPNLDLSISGYPSASTLNVNANSLFVPLISQNYVYSYCGVVVTIYKPGLKAVNMGFYFGSLQVKNLTFGGTGGLSAGTFGIPAAYGPSYLTNCSVGISGIGFSTANAQRTIYFLADPANGFTNINILSPKEFDTKFQIFCLIQCISPNTYNHTTDQCQPCNPTALQYCIACTTAPVCDTCTNSSFAIDVNGTCRYCSFFVTNCSTCSLTTCLTCNVGYYLNSTNNSCIQCHFALSNCTACSSDTVCTTCLNTSYLSTNVCNPCDTFVPNCTTCSSATFCTSCTAAPTLILYGNACPTCDSIMPGCLYCSVNNICTQCIDTSYFLNSSNLCQPCSSNVTNCDNCTLFNNSVFCLSCNAGYYLSTPDSTNHTTCISCSTLIQCYICTSATVCVTCNTGYLLSPDSSYCGLCSTFIANCTLCASSMQCSICIAEYYVDTSVVPIGCTPCTYMTGCIHCTVEKICLTCSSSSYYLNTIYISGTATVSTSQCVLCSVPMLYCLQCTDSFTCTNCTTPISYLNYTDNKCYPCSTLLSNCITCSTPFICITCTPLTYYLNTTTFHCQLCAPYFSNCIQCDFVTQRCLKCDGTTYLDSSGKCSCLVGKPIGQVCYLGYGCNEAVQLANGTIQCTGCMDGFTLSPVNNTCVCTTGYYLTGYCTSVIGCLAVVQRNNVTYCAYCNISLNFVSTGTVCACRQFYYLPFNSTQCVEICGDGYLFTLPCDDGNVVSGDGCSSTCQMEDNYKCQNGTSTSPSKCLFYGETFSLTLINIYKKDSSNTGYFSFQLSPLIPQLAKMNMSTYLHFNFTQHSQYQIGQIQYDSNTGILSFKAEYQKNLQGLNAAITLYFDPLLFLRIPNTTLEFQMISTSTPLIISKFQDQYVITHTSLGYMSYIVLILFVLGTLTHKMIGVEAIHVFQLIYFLQLMANTYTQMISSLDGLRFINGGGDLWGDGRIPLALGRPATRLGLTAEMLRNWATIGIFQLFCIIFYLIFRIRLKYRKNQYNNNKTSIGCKQKYEQAEKAIGFAYRIVLFPSMIGFSFITFISIGLQCFYYSSLPTDRFPSWLDPLACCLALGLQAMVVAFEFLGLMVGNGKAGKGMVNLERCEKTYVAKYCIYTVLIIIVMLISPLLGWKLALATLCIIFAVYLVYIIINRPYRDGLHNASIIINHLTVLIFALFLLIQYFIQVTEVIEVFFVVGTAGLLLGVVGLTIARTIFQGCRKWKQYKNGNLFIVEQFVKPKEQIQREEQFMKEQQQIDNQLRNMNPYRLQTQQNVKLFGDLKEVNQFRKRWDVVPLAFSPKFTDTEAIIPITQLDKSAHSHKSVKQPQQNQKNIGDEAQESEEEELKVIKRRLKENLMAVKREGGFI